MRTTQPATMAKQAMTRTSGARTSRAPTPTTTAAANHRAASHSASHPTAATMATSAATKSPSATFTIADIVSAYDSTSLRRKSSQAAVVSPALQRPNTSTALPIGRHAIGSRNRLT